MPSIPQSLLWISLVVLWLFVLVPMLINKRETIRRTSDVALATRVLLDEKPVVVVATHLESHTTPPERAVQMQALIHAIDDYADGDPVLLGGDFNTRTAGDTTFIPLDMRLLVASRKIFRSPSCLSRFL